MKTLCFVFSLCVLQVLGDSCKKTLGRNCECKTSKHTINLEEYATSPPFTTKDDSGRSYTYNPCVPILKSAVDSNECDAAALWMTAVNNSNISLATFNSFDFVGDPDKNSLQINYTVGAKNTTVVLECKPTGDPQFQYVTVDVTNTFQFKLQTPIVCTSDASNSTSGGLSTGSILLIVFFVLIVVYIVGGVLYLRFAHGARGLEQIPNYDFWLDFPGLVKDGASFLMRGCKPAPNYQEI